MAKVAKPARTEPVARTEVVYSAAITMDGFIADEQGGVDWLHAAMVPGEGYGLEAFTASIDAVLMGSRTYEKALELGDPGAGSSMPWWVFSRREFKSKGTMTVTDADPSAIVGELPARGIWRAWLM